MPMINLEGKNFILTGSTGTIGTAVAIHLDNLGANLILVGRNLPKLEKLRSSLTGQTHKTFEIDITSPESWALLEPQLDQLGALDGIVTMAGRTEPLGPFHEINIGEFTATLHINLMGSLLPIAKFVDRIAKVRGSIVVFSGGGATSPLPYFDAYSATKIALVRIVENLSIEMRDKGVTVNAIAPGFIVSDMHDATLAAGPGNVGNDYYEKTKAVVRSGGDSPHHAAGLVAFLLSKQEPQITGKLISAVWDPWQDESFLARLRSDTDFATLRRVDGQFYESLAAIDK
jgi:NAD(P)-dependent dehydrogenase (short-subunit alcohol dehydrogenase family)